jgi:hypothetical protein
MALKDDLLPLVDELRAIPGELGFRPYQVFVRKTQYAGPRIGVGAVSVTETQLFVGGQNPKVREKKSRDVVAGTSEFAEMTFEIGPLTPAFPGGGIADEIVSPEKNSTPTTIHFLLKGPGLPESGLLCKRIDEDVDRPLRKVIRVESIGLAKP